MLQADDNELFEYVLRLAGHGVPNAGPARLMSDHETIDAAKWIAKNARKLNKSQGALKWKDLAAILRGFGCSFEDREGNSVVIRRGSMTAFTGRRNSGDEIDVEGVAHIRKSLELDEAHGIDSSTFYYNAEIVPDFINHYRQLLRRLASY